MATIKDVAKKAGVSVATVSRLLNKNGYVGAESEKKITAAIKELNYSPNAVARSLSTKTSPLIGLLVPDLSNPYFPQLAKGIEVELSKKGYSVLLGSVDDEKGFVEYLETFKQNNVAGVISSVGFIPSKNKDLTIVEVDRISQGSRYTVTGNDFMGGMLIGEKLIESKSCHKILLISGPKSVKKSNDRSMGIKEALKRTNVSIEEIETSSFELDNSDEIINKLFSMPALPDTIIAPNDLYAVLLVQELLKHHISIPEEVQIIGYDGIQFIDIIFPKIATISQPIYELGKKSAELLMNIIEDRTVKENHVLLDVDFQPGDTLR